MSLKVVPIVEKTKDCMSWTGIQLLEKAIQEIKAGKFPDRILLIGLDTKDNSFIPYWRKAGIINSEAIAVCEIVKGQCIEYLEGRMVPLDEEDEE
jgi:hypothetical protein